MAAFTKLKSQYGGRRTSTPTPAPVPSPIPASRSRSRSKHPPNIIIGTPPGWTDEDWNAFASSIPTEQEEAEIRHQRRIETAQSVFEYEKSRGLIQSTYTVHDFGLMEAAIEKELIRAGVTSRNTLSAYMGHVKRFGEWRRGKRVNEKVGQRARIDDWLVELRERVSAGELKASTFNQALSAMKAVVRACERWIVDGEGPYGEAFTGKMAQEAWAQQMLSVLGMKWEKVSRWKYREGKWLSVENVEKLLNSVDTGTLLGKRDLAMLALMFGLGLRRHEVVKVRREMFSTGSGRVMLQGLVRKGGKVQDLPVSDWVWKCVESWCVRAGIGSGYVCARLDSVDMGGEVGVVWVVVRDGNGRESGKGNGAGEPVAITERWVRGRLRDLCEAAGVEVVNPHDGRRTFGKVYLEKGGNIEQLRIAYGHEQLRTTQVYVNSGVEVGRGKAVSDVVGSAYGGGEGERKGEGGGGGSECIVESS